MRRYTRYGRGAFLEDEQAQDAVLRNLSVIGEAASRLTLELRRTHESIAWDGAIGLRHVVVHDYFRISLDRIWDVVERDLPHLDGQIAGLVGGSA